MIGRSRQPASKSWPVAHFNLNIHLSATVEPPVSHIQRLPAAAQTRTGPSPPCHAWSCATRQAFLKTSPGFPAPRDRRQLRRPLDGRHFSCPSTWLGIAGIKASRHIPSWIPRDQMDGAGPLSPGLPAPGSAHVLTSQVLDASQHHAEMELSHRGMIFPRSSRSRSALQGGPASSSRSWCMESGILTGDLIMALRQTRAVSQWPLRGTRALEYLCIYGTSCHAKTPSRSIGLPDRGYHDTSPQQHDPLIHVRQSTR